VRRRLVEQPTVQVPAELVMGPRVDVWADDAALARLGGAPVDSAEGWAVMIGAWRNHQDAIHAWAEQTGRTWRQARTLIPSRRPYWPGGGNALNRASRPALASGGGGSP